MAAPLITGTAGGTITLPCSLVSANVAWGTAGSPTMIAVINPGDVTGYVTCGGSGVVATQANSIPVPPGQTVFIATGANTFIAGITLRNGTQLSIVPST